MTDSFNWRPRLRPIQLAHQRITVYDASRTHKICIIRTEQVATDNMFRDGCIVGILLTGYLDGKGVSASYMIQGGQHRWEIWGKYSIAPKNGRDSDVELNRMSHLFAPRKTGPLDTGSVDFIEAEWKHMSNTPCEAAASHAVAFSAYWPGSYYNRLTDRIRRGRRILFCSN